MYQRCRAKQPTLPRNEAPLPTYSWHKMMQMKRFGSFHHRHQENLFPWLWLSSHAIKKGYLHNTINPFLCFEHRGNVSQWVLSLNKYLILQSSVTISTCTFPALSHGWELFPELDLVCVLGFPNKGLNEKWWYLLNHPAIVSGCPNSGTAGSTVDKNYPAVKTQTLHCSSTQFSLSLCSWTWRCVK